MRPPRSDEPGRIRPAAIGGPARWAVVGQDRAYGPVRLFEPVAESEARRRSGTRVPLPLLFSRLGRSRLPAQAGGEVAQVITLAVPVANAAAVPQVRITRIPYDSPGADTRTAISLQGVDARSAHARGQARGNGFSLCRPAMVVCSRVRCPLCFEQVRKGPRD
jgi:hypothetical protein